MAAAPIVVVTDEQKETINDIGTNIKSHVDAIVEVQDGGGGTGDEPQLGGVKFKVKLEDSFNTMITDTVLNPDPNSAFDERVPDTIGMFLYYLIPKFKGSLWKVFDIIKQISDFEETDPSIILDNELFKKIRLELNIIVRSGNAIFTPTPKTWGSSIYEVKSAIAYFNAFTCNINWQNSVAYDDIELSLFYKEFEEYFLKQSQDYVISTRASTVRPITLSEARARLDAAYSRIRGTEEPSAEPRAGPIRRGGPKKMGGGTRKSRHVCSSCGHHDRPPRKWKTQRKPRRQDDGHQVEVEIVAL